MLNETMQLTYENVTTITQTPQFMIIMLVVWLLPIIFYIIFGAIAKAKSPSGQTLSKKMIAYPNFWIAVTNWFFLQGSLILILLIFPVWLKLI